jgi:hypothetical protein
VSIDEITLQLYAFWGRKGLKDHMGSLLFSLQDRMDWLLLF